MPSVKPQPNIKPTKQCYGSESARVRIAYYAGPEKKTSYQPWAFFLERLQYDTKTKTVHKDFFIQQVDAKQIRKGILEDSVFNMIVIPGGMAPRKADELGKSGRKSMTKLLKEGKINYVGICAGAYLCCDTDDDYQDSWNWGYINAEIMDLDHWNRGSGNRCNLSLTKAGKELYELSTKKSKNTNKPTLSIKKPRIAPNGVTVRYANGPLFLLNQRKDHEFIGNKVHTFCQFETNFTKHKAPLIQKGSPAIIGGHFGKGRCLAISPHPEKSTDKKVGILFRQLLRWTAQVIHLEGDLK